MIPIYLTLPKITARNDSSLSLLHYSLEKTVKTGIVGYVVVRHLRYGHVAALLVALDVKVEILVLYPEVLVLWSVQGLLGVS
jgi:hypothetical protein